MNLCAASVYYDVGRLRPDEQIQEDTNMNKKMKWMLIAILAVIVLAGGAFAAAHMVTKDVQEEVTVEETPLYELTGEVTQAADGYFVMLDAMHGEVQVNIGDDTLYDGAESGEVAVGQFVTVLYDGKMTRSLPAQVYALRVGVYPIAGEVTQVGEGSVTIVRAEAGDEVIVSLPEGAPQLEAGMQVTVYTNGMMTMSIPAQTHAIGIVIE